MIPVTVIDFEGDKANGIVEVGAVRLDTPWSLYTQTWVSPRTSAKLLQFCGLSPAPSAGTFESEGLPRLLNLRRSSLFLAHHAATEDVLLRQYMPYVPQVLGVEENVSTWGPWLDTLTLTKHIYPGLPSYELSFLIKSLQLTRALAERAILCPEKRRRYHAAPYDALATALLWEHLRAQAPLLQVADWLSVR